ncbi:WD40 repeat-like protein [Ceratobasidium sp. AG-I]|nr:WD40 repeat-like protein [Ceratobasidium sp. AG-I]
MDRIHHNPSIGAAFGSPTHPADISSPTFLPSEPPFISGTRTPPERAGTSKRKLTLLALIDELAQLRDEEQDKEKDINYAPTADERQSSESEAVERFRIFDERIRNLDLKLQAFANAVRQLGSSAGLLNAAYHLRARLTQIQYFFRENAAELFDDIAHGPNLGTKPYSARRRGKARRSTTLFTSVSPTSNNKPWLNDTEHLPKELEYLAKDLHSFLDRLNDVPEFSDEAVNASIMSFEGDLRYRASCLREFEGQLKFVAVAQYINDLTEDLGVHMDSMKASLTIFIEVGVPTIRFSQKHTATGLQNLSTVATFFSGVTATTLQVSYEETGSPLPDLVNALWISSLVFSIASAINSQLAYHWRAAMYRSPRSYVPWWVAIWITRTPLFFLVGSVIAFSAGLCVFTYSSHQSPAVSAVVTTFTSVTSSALLCVGLWFASERWTFAKTKGNRWLLDVLEEHTNKAAEVTGVAPAKRQASRAATIGVKHTQTFFSKLIRALKETKHRVTGVTGQMAEAMASMVHVPRAVFARTVSTLAIVTDGLSTSNQGDTESQEDNMRTDSPTTMFNTDNGSGNLGVSGYSEKRKLSDLGRGTEFTIPEDKPLNVSPATPLFTTSPPGAAEYLKPTESDGITGASTGASTSNSANAEPAGRAVAKNARFKAIAKQVANSFKLAPPVHAPEPIRSMSSPSFMSESRHRRDSSEQMNPTRMQGLVPMLRTLRSSQMLGEHVALVKHLQFSPDGQFLATCSWDKTALIWRVGSGPSDEFSVMHKLVHTSRIGGFVNQVAWSPSGDQLLTKQIKTVKVWDTKTGVCKKTIDRKRNVQSITWMPKGSGFVSVEWRLGTNSAEAKKRVHHVDNIQGSDLVIMSADGKVIGDHYLPRLQVWDAAVTPNEERVVAVASLLSSMDNLKPMKSRNEKRILVYNLQTKEIENQVPLLQEVRDVTLTEQGNYALVSYENKAPPQAWRLDMIAREQKCRLVLAHTYFTKHPVDFAGPSYFGGVNDTFVLCASKGGEIYIWERASGILLHSLKAPDQELTNIAWNHKSPSGFMFASAAHDGIVRIWTTTARPTLLQPSRSHASSPEPAEVESPPHNRTEFSRPSSPPMAGPGRVTSPISMSPPSSP